LASDWRDALVSPLVRRWRHPQLQPERLRVRRDKPPAFPLENERCRGEGVQGGAMVPAGEPLGFLSADAGQQGKPIMSSGPA